MKNELQFSIITASLGNLGDRFLTAGYKEEIDLEQKSKKASGISGIKGVELWYGADGDEACTGTIRELLDKYNLLAPIINAPLTSLKKWHFGTISAKDDDIRKQAIEVVKRTIDFAVGVRAEAVNLWMGQDGCDYPFQVDYTEQWEKMIEGLRECADYNPAMQISLEFKPREPRNRALLNTAATTLLIINETDRKNVGITVDIGHVLQHGENMAQVVELCARYGKLFNLHLNDNYSTWDDDMIVGSVYLVEQGFESLYGLCNKV